MANFFSFLQFLSPAVASGILLLAAPVETIGGDREERTYDVGNFTEIYLYGPYEVVLTQGPSSGVRIEADAAVFEDIEVEVHREQLSIEWEGGKFKHAKDIELQITFTEMKKLEILGAVDLRSEDVLQVGNLKIEFEGAGNLQLQLEAEKVISEITGVGNFTLSGTAEYHKVEFSGVGKYDARDLLSQYALVESNGVGSVKVHAARKFIGEANGVGSVDYYGDPEDVTIDATGIGSIDRH